MKTQNIDLKIGDSLCDSFLAYPNDKEKFPGVLLYMDAFGLRPYLEEMAKTLAGEGYFVFVPNLLYRSKRSPLTDAKFPLKKEETPAVYAQLKPLLQSFTPELCLKDGRNYLDFLSQHERVRPGKMGITGYCMGGSHALRAAAEFPNQIASVASFHASNLATDTENSPHLLFKKIKGEVYLGHADNDQGMPPEQMDRVRQELEKAKLKFKSELYPNAAHGFTMADLPAYNEEALKRHWNVLKDVFKRNLR